ncbi:MAG: hypothetical protein E7313_02400 [Clostridiales bacterium]|nr:hypothetical protein [Clostridiales bacterium]
MGNSGIETIIYVTIVICVLLVIALVGVFAYIWWRDKKLANKTNTGKSETSKDEKTTHLQGVESMSKFLSFDEIVDSMIVRKNGTQYVMVIHCKGINYDLLGEEEKLAVEGGFTQFLNTLRFPVQLYIQTRSLNLRDSIDQYEEKVNEIKEDIGKIEVQIKKEKANGRADLVRRLEFEKRRKLNILEYGMDITNYVNKLSQNKNVLQQNTYLAVSYYTAEFGGEISNYSKEEIDNIAFSELYTRAQTLIRALSASGVSGRVINSEELAELLYIAYNRDDSEIINIKKSVEAEYDSLYNTAKDVIEKQKQMIEDKVEQETVDLVANSILKADKIIKIREEKKAEIKQRAMEYVESYKNEMTEELYAETKKQIEKNSVSEEEKKVKSKQTVGTKKVEQERTTTKVRKVKKEE